MVKDNNQQYAGQSQSQHVPNPLKLSVGFKATVSYWRKYFCSNRSIFIQVNTHNKYKLVVCQCRQTR